MSTYIYDNMIPLSSSYEKNLNMNSNNFVPLGSKKREKKSDIKRRTITPSPITTSLEKRAPKSSTMTAVYGLRGTPPIYDKDLGRPFSPITVNRSLDTGRSSFKSIAQRTEPDEPSTISNRGSPTYIDYQRSILLDNNKQDVGFGDDWGFHDRRFKGGKKRTRKVCSRSVRRKRTKRIYLRRYRSRKRH